MDSKILSLFNYGNETDYDPLLEFFFAEEYRSLTQKSPNDNLRLFEYQNYSKLPLLLSNQLFQAFGKGSKGSVSKDSYLKSLMTIYTASIDERILFLFSFLTGSRQDCINKEDTAVLFRHLFISVINAKDIKVYNIHFIDDLIESFFKKMAGESKCNQDEFRLIIINEDASLFFLFYYAMSHYKPFSKGILDYLRYQINTSETIKKRPKTTLNEISIFKGRSDYRTFSDYKTNQVYSIQDEGNWTFQSFIDKASCYIKPPSQSMISFFDYMINIKSESSEEREESSFSELDELTLFESEVVSTKSNFNEEPNKRKNTLSSLSGLLPFESKEALTTTGFNSFQNNRKCSDNNQSLTFAFSPKSKNRNAIEFQQDVSLLNLSPPQDKNYLKNKEFVHCFSEDEIVIPKDKAYHKYKIALNGAMIFLSKWNKQISQYIYNKLIPMRHLYIKESNNVCTNEGYYPVELISFIYWPKKEFSLYFLSQDAKTRFIQSIEENNNYREIEDFYSFDKDIGKGHFSKVIQGTNNTTNEKVAIKVITRSTDLKETEILKWEIDLSRFIQVCQNDHVVKIYDIFKTIDHVYIVMEYFEVGSLTSYLQHNESCLPSQTVFSLLNQLINALRYCEHFGLVHRDIKPDNILIRCSALKQHSNILAKISDFGLGQITLPNEKRKENYGTLLFTAPEILLGVEYDSKVDVWSLGVLSYYLEYTYLPFNIKISLSQREISNSVISNTLIIPRKYNHKSKDEDVQRKIVNFIQLALQKDWRNRPKASDINLESIS